MLPPITLSARAFPSASSNGVRRFATRSDVTANEIPKKVSLAWKTDVSATALPTAPVVAGGLVFVADRSGAVYAFGRDGKQVWKTYTAGPIYYPPAIAHDRLFVGSADGRVYAFEARSGRHLWSFRAGPKVDRIPVFGKLISRWPVAGGVVVSDDGPELTEKERIHLLDPFFSGRQAGRGLGFGLPKCWRIVQNHAGRITCRSTDNETEFIVYWPTATKSAPHSAGT